MVRNAIDIFSGAGGMSLGAMMAGINIKIAVEKDSQAAATFKFNHPETTVVSKDIKEVSFVEEDIFALFGGPPCQGFSFSNTKTRNIGNNNNSLFKEFIRSVVESNAKWFVFENVEGFVKFNKGQVYRDLKETFTSLGYTIEDAVLTASDYGVPQKRNRFFLVGNKLGIKFTFPTKYDKAVSVEEAISDLPDLNNGDSADSLPYKEVELSEYAKHMRGDSILATQNFVSRNQDYVIERYTHIDQGQNWKSIPEDMMKNYKDTANCHSGIYRRLDPKQPSVVIANYRKNMLIHPFQHRGLSVREAARIQSFPDNFVFKGTLTSQQQQIGNAVPPLLARAIFEQILTLTANYEQKISQGELHHV